MICPHPKVVRNAGTVPCGRCMPCRINRRRQKTARLYLEHTLHAESIFVTLTYNDEHIPEDYGLRRKDFQDFMKRYRAATRPVRFAMCGEYGEKYDRPHYHAILYGRSFEQETADVLAATWGKGFVDVRPVHLNRMAYVASYTVKKFTQKGQEQVKGRPEEFAGFSLRPDGLGAKAALEMAKNMEGKYGTAREITRTGDVPRTIRMFGKTYPLDNYILNIMRRHLGVPLLAKERFDGEEERPPLTPHDYWKASRKEHQAEARFRASSTGRVH